jgi:lipopolysaccharide transport system ATP-binding protein
MSSEISIRVQNLSKCYHIYDKPHDRLLQMLSFGRRQYYREFWALKDVSFEIKKGETVGIIGRNGSGKSTLLQMICGTLNTTEGSAEIVGKVAALLELGAGFNIEFSGRENVYLNGTLLGLSKSEIDGYFQEIAAFADIGEFIEQPVKIYSSGMYVRLAFAIAIHVKPDILVVDEALAVGDARFQSKCMARIKKMQSQGMSIIFVSHDMSSVRSLCDKAIWLDEGKVREQGDIALVTAHYLEHIFSGDSNPEIIPLETPTNTGASTPKETPNLIPAYQSIAPQPVSSWGMVPGCIRWACITDATGKSVTTLTIGGSYQIRVGFISSPKMSDANLHVAFSLKNLAGLDLIVRSTFDSPAYKVNQELSEPGLKEVVFTYLNILNKGRYTLAVALERRSDSEIQYFEYLDGVLFLETITDRSYFGVVVPEIEATLHSHSLSQS